MNVLIVLAHPEQQSFNAHLAHLATKAFVTKGDAVKTSDLYAQKFDPVEGAHHFLPRQNPNRFDAQTEQRNSFESNTLPSDVKSEIEKIEWADLVIFQFPLWWFGMPAILKGWMDRIFVYGGLYSSKRRHDTGFCKGKKALMCVTTGSSAEACSHNGIEGDTRLILWPSLYALRYVGFSVLEPVIFNNVHGGPNRQGVAQQQVHLDQISRDYVALLEHINEMSELPFNSASDWDDRGQLKPQAPSHNPFIRQRRELILT